MTRERRKYIPKTKAEVLAELKEVDRYNLLDVKVKERKQSSEDILIAKFEKINDFVDENNRIPDEKQMTNPIEFELFSNLNEIRLNNDHIMVLTPYDRHGLLIGLLEATYKEESTLEEQELENVNSQGLEDTFGLLATPKNSIFNLKNVKSHKEKITTMPKTVARRKKCKDFNEFEPLFQKCQKEIEAGDRKVVQFRNEHDVALGAFFIYGGVKCYVAEIGDLEIKNNRPNARLRLIFENGQESNMYKRSLTAELYKDGRRVLPARLKSGENEISKDETTGFIYILTSKSDNLEIKSIPNLHKIGFSTTSVEERVKNAKEETTYLMADVNIIASYRVAGIKATYFENLIHKLFDHVRLKVEITDKKGKEKQAKEWFSVPYDVIEDAISLIVSGDIIEFVYDSQKECLIKK